MASPSRTNRVRAEVAAWNPGQTWQPPSKAQRLIDVMFRRLCLFFAAMTIVLIVLLVFEIAVKAIPAFREHGLRFLYSATWDPNKGVYGILPEIWGTLYTSLLALFFGSAFGIAAA